ncbi:MAG: hypothetical protein ACYS0H_18135 [Planctomycetota bacterium]|jgi:hypothetical protein
MGLFTKKQKLKPLPRAQGSIEGEKYLRGTLQSELDVPVRSMVDLTPMQQLVMQGLPAMYSGVVGATGQARDYYTDVLQGDYDPFTGPRASAMRGELDYMKRRAITTANQEASRLGGLTSTPAAGVRANIRGQYDRIAASQLAALYGEERDRKERAAGALPQVERGAIGAAGEVASIADMDRQIQQMREDAVFAAAMRAFLMPFQEIANIAQGLMNFQPAYAMTGGGLKDWAAGLSMAAPIIGGALAGGMFSGGGGGAGAPGIGTSPGPAGYNPYGVTEARA